MKLSYDPKANVAYIRLRQQDGDVQTIQLTADVHIDIDATGTVCGIELLNANKQLTEGDNGKLVFEDLLKGEQTELSVA